MLLLQRLLMSACNLSPIVSGRPPPPKGACQWGISVQAGRQKMFCTNYYFCCLVAYFHLPPRHSPFSTLSPSLLLFSPCYPPPLLVFFMIMIMLPSVHFAFLLSLSPSQLCADLWQRSILLPSFPPPPLQPLDATGIDDTAIVLCVSVCLLFAAIVCSGNAMLFLRIC